MRPIISLLKVVALIAPIAAVPAALAEVTEQTVAPADPNIKYSVSDRGVHLAAVVRKGSRLTVTVDGTAGPKVDEVFTPTPWIDPRPAQARQASATRASGRHQTDQLTPVPVVFCADGSHFAYLARQSEELVLFEDHKEILRIPMAAGADLRLQFTGPDGKHLLFARSGYPGAELWFDGQKWPGTFASAGSGLDSIDPIISPDGEHVAYVAQIDREKHALIVDGRDAGYLGSKLQFTSDSRHLISLAQMPKGTALLVDGKPRFTARQIVAYYCAPATNRLAAILTHQFPDGSQGQFVLLDGKPVEATLCKNGIQAVLFSPDGQHCAALCSNAANIYYVVADGKKGEEYDAIGSLPLPGMTSGMAFSPDSSRLFYVAHGGGKYFMVINGEESDEALDSVGGVVFSADGRHFAYSGYLSSQPKSPVIVDGKAERFERMISINDFDFSPDGSRYAYVVSLPNGGGALYVDGKPTQLGAMNFAFSPDSRHIAVSGYRPADNVTGLWVDGTLVYKGERTPDYLAFSGDSQHLFWKVVEPDKAKPGYWGNVTYADGQPVASGDNVGLYKMLTVPTGYSDYTVHPGWQAVGPSSLVCLAAIGDAVKRITITPANTNLASLIAGAAGAAPHPSR